MKQKILLFPYSGTAIEALDCLSPDFEMIGFISDNTEVIGNQYFGYTVFDRSIIEKEPTAKLLAFPGNPNNYLKRKEIIESLNLPLERFATLIHQKAVVSPHANIGKNVLIMAGVVVTSNAKIGNHICILPNSVIHHDVVIEDLCLIAANATIAGNVHIGKNCYIGAASSIKNGLSIEANSLIGIGSNIIKDVSSATVMVGNPAMALRKI